ncbi:hypothetical protein [Stieleria neptunia]|uniref:hypothetical protein n=1 Tax=Stieleria neptunia TaxID=2527979 RepID=UPI0011A92E8A|nr:hypothetical protein [Stieleria neptunia]
MSFAVLRWTFCHKNMSSPDAGDIVQEALDSRRVADGRVRLDAWQASQPVNLDTLSKLRYYRPLLGQHDEAIDAAQKMIELRPHDAWERMSDHLRLGELYVEIGELEHAWAALNVVIDWPEIKDWYSAGMARSTVELALDISAAASRENELSEMAFDAAVQLLDDGCSTSFCLLEKARDCSRRLRRGGLFERFKRAAVEEHERIQRQLEGR